MENNDRSPNLNILSTFVLLAGFLYIPRGKKIEQLSVSRAPASMHLVHCRKIIQTYNGCRRLLGLTALLEFLQ